MKFAIATAFAVLIGSVGPAYAAIEIAGTNFNSRTVSGATASNLNWSVNGVADPGNLTAVAVTPVSPAIQLFNTTHAQGRFAVNQNIGDESDWFVDIPLSVLGSPIALGQVSLDAFIFNNSGALQTVERELDLRAELFLGLGGTVLVSSDFEDNVYVDGGTIPPPGQPRTETFDFSGITLQSNTDYTFRITASRDGTTGNNAGFDNLSITGSVLPEPTSLLIWGMLGVVGMKRRKR